MNKIWEGITFFIIMFKELAIIIYAIILAKNPCKKCIVQACCSERCEDRTVFENFILRGETLKHQKLFAWFFTTYLSCIIIYATYQIFKKF